MKSLTILLVEDDEIIRLKFKKVCSSLNLNHSIIEAENGEKALAVLKNHNFDLIISDLKMPVMNGLQFIEELKKDAILKKIPVVVMTTSEEEKDLNSCNNFGVNGFFKKSLNFSEYKKDVTAILNNWSGNKVIA